jgi:hypothetical protein
MPAYARRCVVCGKSGATVSPDNQARVPLWYCDNGLCEPRGRPRPVQRAIVSPPATREARAGDRVCITFAYRRARTSEIGKFARAEDDEWVGQRGVVIVDPSGIGGDRTTTVRLDDGREAVVRSYRCRRIP